MRTRTYCPSGARGTSERRFYKHTAPLGAGEMGLGSLQTYCPAGAGEMGLGSLQTYCPAGAGEMGLGSLQTYCPAGAGEMGLGSLQTYCPAGYLIDRIAFPPQYPSNPIAS